jgi:hypothetical protein
LGAIASFFAGLGTSIGPLGIFLLRKPSSRTLNAFISGAARHADGIVLLTIAAGN